MWLSKFSSLRSRSKPLALGPLHESLTHAALIRLRCLDAVAYVCGLAVAAAHVLLDLLPMSQAVCEHGIYVGETECVVRLDYGLRSGAAPKGMYDHLEQDARVADAKDPAGSSLRGTVTGSIIVMSERGERAMTSS